MINLGDKKWGVKDSGLLAYKQVGSKYFNKDFDFTRASSGTYIDKNGLLQTAEVYNLIDYSQDFTQWTNSLLNIDSDFYISPNNVLNASFAVPTATSGIHKLREDLTTVTGLYTHSIYAKQGGYKNLLIWDDTTSGGIGVNLDDLSIFRNQNNSGYNVQDVGNGWVRIDVTISYSSQILRPAIYIYDNSATPQISFTADGVSGVYIYGAQLVEGTEARDYQYTNGRVGIPRIDFSDGVGALLLEPQSTNLRELSNTYVGDATIRGTISNDASAVSPSGSLGVEYLTATGTNGLVLDSSFLTGDGTFSVYLKRKTGVGDIRMSINGGVDYTTMAVTDVWKRFSLSSTTGLGQLVISCLTSGDEVYIWGWQEESLSYPTSIIKTEGSAVTRIADVANNCGTEQDFNSEEGVLYAEILKEVEFTGQYILLSINDNSGNDNNSVTIGFDNEDDFYARIKSFGTTNLLYTSTAANKGQFYKMALKYKDGDNAIWIDGVEVFTTSSTISFSNPLNRIDFAYNSANGLPFYGKVRSVKYFPTALTDEELENLTT